MSTVIHPVSAEELLRMPDDGFRYELVKGEIRKMAPAGSLHGNVAIRVTLPLAQYVNAFGTRPQYWPCVKDSGPDTFTTCTVDWPSSDTRA